MAAIAGLRLNEVLTAEPIPICDAVRCCWGGVVDVVGEAGVALRGAEGVGCAAPGIALGYCWGIIGDKVVDTVNRASEGKGKIAGEGSNAGGAVFFMARHCWLWLRLGRERLECSISYCR